MRDGAAACVLRPTRVIFLAAPPQETPEVAARALVFPDHPIDLFVAEREAALGLQPDAYLLRTPPFRPQFAGDGATDTARQFARFVPDLFLSDQRCVPGLLKAIPPPPCVPSQLPADRPWAEPSA